MFFRRILVLGFLVVPFLGHAHEVSDKDQEILRNGGLEAYVQVGATHMLTGYDHLLFLVGVVFFLHSLKDIFKFITIFTLGHCITLITATFLGIKANEHLVDAVIALSVIYKGYENLGGFEKWAKTTSWKLFPPNILFMVGVFGLIHGFGLATRLQTFDMGTNQFLEKILCFNLGVEVGQVLALIPIVLVLQFARKQSQFSAFYKALNWYLVVVGLVLLFYQLFGYLN